MILHWLSASDNFQVSGFTFSHVQAYVSKTDLAVKLAKVILGPSIERTCTTEGWGPRYYIPSFVKIGQTVLEKISELF